MILPPPARTRTVGVFFKDETAMTASRFNRHAAAEIPVTWGNVKWRTLGHCTQAVWTPGALLRAPALKQAREQAEDTHRVQRSGDG